MTDIKKMSGEDLIHDFKVRLYEDNNYVLEVPENLIVIEKEILHRLAEGERLKERVRELDGILRSYPDICWDEATQGSFLGKLRKYRDEFKDTPNDKT